MLTRDENKKNPSRPRLNVFTTEKILIVICFTANIEKLFKLHKRRKPEKTPNEKNTRPGSGQ